MIYSTGNYYAYSKTTVNNQNQDRHAYIIGGGISSLSTAAFLLRDAKMSGENIHILEKEDEVGGAYKKLDNKSQGYILEGGRDLDVHFEVLWDLLRSIPSLENKDISLLDEIVWLNQESPIKPTVRCTAKQGEEVNTTYEFNLSKQGLLEIFKLAITPENLLYDKTVDDILSKEVLDSDFWRFFSSSFGFKKAHSVIEMKRYLIRYMYDVDKVADQSSLISYKYSAVESLIKPLTEYLVSCNVDFKTKHTVQDVDIQVENDVKSVKSIFVKVGEETKTISLGEDDVVFIPIGSASENMNIGSQTKPAILEPVIKEDSSWQLWMKIAQKDYVYGNPHKFLDNIDKSKWVTATITTLDEKIPAYIKSISRSPMTKGTHLTGGYIMIKDSPWKLNWTFGRQPVLKNQPKEQLVGWMYAITPDKEGAFIKKPMSECTGCEICMEWLYHLGVPSDKIEEIATNSANTVPVIYPFIAAGLIPRAIGDRPDVVLENAKNFAFLGQFAKIKAENILTVEYAVRTAMEAVYTLFNVTRPVPEVWGSCYDVRNVARAMNRLADGKKLEDIFDSGKTRKLVKEFIKLSEGTDIYNLLEQYDLI